MKHVDIWEASGSWFFAVYIAGRITVIGACASRERAQQESSVA